MWMLGAGGNRYHLYLCDVVSLCGSITNQQVGRQSRQRVHQGTPCARCAARATLAGYRVPMAFVRATPAVLHPKERLA